MKTIVQLSLVAALGLGLLAGCGEGDKGGGSAPAKHKQEDQGHAHGTGPHNGVIVHVGEGAGHVEFLHDPETGKIDLYVLGDDSKTPGRFSNPPALNLKTPGGPIQVPCQPMDAAQDGASHFEAVHAVLRSEHLDGQIAISIAGKDYFLAFPCHEHDEHEHAGHAHGENTLSHTAWTAACEWFVELDTPEPGKPAAFAAHVTLLDGFKPAASGAFRVEARTGTRTAETHAAAPARPGIFTPEITFPSAGDWTLRLHYEGSGISDTIEWNVHVHEGCPAQEPEEHPAGAVSFLKEQQWKIPFDTAEVKGKSVPETAVLEAAGEKIVYVQLEGELFQKRIVRTGDRKDGRIEILAGLAGGERVVTRGAVEIQKAAKE